MSDWIDPAILALFIPTFFFVSVTPGMCMTLAMTLGMSLGVRRTLHMMWGELVGVGLVSVLSVVGVAAVMLIWAKRYFLYSVILITALSFSFSFSYVSPAPHLPIF